MADIIADSFLWIAMVFGIALGLSILNLDKTKERKEKEKTKGSE